jgi:hypothetical protein
MIYNILHKIKKTKSRRENFYSISTRIVIHTPVRIPTLSNAQLSFSPCILDRSDKNGF